jgi:hypothetical protein
MPNAWEEFLDNFGRYCATHIEHDVRFAEDIGIFELVSNTTSACGRGIPCDMAKVRLMQRLRGSASFEPKHIYAVDLSAPVQGHKIAAGARLIVLFTDLFPEPDGSITPSICGTMLLNDSNIAVVRQNLDEGDAKPSLQP